jgi:hypothetical protein
MKKRRVTDRQPQDGFTVKNMIVDLTGQQWLQVQEDMLRHNGRSILINWVMRRELGYTRRYKSFLEDDGVCLDFFDDRSLTAFMLKYEGQL